MIQRVIRDCEALAVVEMEPRMIGRSLFAMLGSRPQKIPAKRLDAEPALS